MSDVPQARLNGHGPFAIHTVSRSPAAARGYSFLSQQSDLRACAQAIRKGSKSFHLASRILPVSTRNAALSLYAFCRHSDDLIDDPRADKTALDQLRERLDLIYRGTPSDYSCDRAFHHTVDACAIPKCIPDALLDGFAMDIANRRYRTLGEVKEYATCVAATVGLMMALVMRTGSEDALARAADLGIAMQLTNIARDVGEDARNGRIYLPLDWMHEVGLDPQAFLAAPAFTPDLGQVVERLLQEADRHYRQGHEGIAALPANCRHAIRTAALVYEEIGAEIRANGFDSVSRRAHTRAARKLAILMKARAAESAGESPGENGREEARSGAMKAPPDLAAARLVAAGARAYAAKGYSAPKSTEAGPDETSLERFLTVMIRLQADSRRHSRFHRIAARQRAQNTI